MNQLMPRNQNRRRFLKQAALLAAAGTAGCASKPTDRSTPANRTVGTSSPSATPDGDASTATDEGNTLETTYNARERFGSPGERYDDFEDLTEWSAFSGLLSASSTAYEGTQSAKLVGKGGEGALIEYAANGEDFTDTEVSLAVRTTTPDNIAVNIRLVDVFGNYAVRSLRKITHVDGDYGWFRTAPGTFTTSGDAFDPSQIGRLQIHMLNASDGRAELLVDDLRTHSKPDKGYIVLSWDDNRRAYYDTAAPINDSHGYPVSMATAPRLVGQGENFMSVNQLTERQKKGDEIVAHASVQLGFEDMTTEELDRTLRQNKKWLHNQGFTGSDTIVYPGNNYDRKVLSAATKYHYMGGMNQSGSLNTTGVYSFDPLVLPRTIGWDLSIAKRVVDNAARFKECGILNFHDFSLKNTMSAADYKKLLAYIEQKGDALEVITLGELWELRKQA